MEATEPLEYTFWSKIRSRRWHCDASVVVMQYPNVRNLWPDTTNPFSQSFKDLTIVPFINCLSLRHEFNMDNNLTFIFDLLILSFFERDEWLVCHSDLCRLVSGSYSRIHDSSSVITCLKKNRHFWCVQEGPGTHSFGFLFVRL